jgi:hypothetical protein
MGYMPADDLQHLVTRIEARTDRILVASGAMFLIWQVGYFTVIHTPRAAFRTVDLVATAGLLAWAGALLMLVATGGGAFRRREVREILDDELARAQRDRAYQNAFWALMLVAFAGYAATTFVEVPARLLAHVSLSAGVLAAVSTLAYLRRR